MSRVAVTCGDPAGVGPEILLRWARERPELAGSVALVGPRTWLDAMAAQGDFECHPVGDSAFRAEPGQPEVAGARVAWDCLERVAEGCRQGSFRAAVTGPVSKTWLRRAGFGFPGQTEFFGARWGGVPVMGFSGERLCLVLATWHLPLSRVPRELDEQSLERAVRAASELAALHGIRQPRIGVCGLNPHAGEGGLLGEEERSWIDPCLTGLREDFPGLSAALPGDTVFWRALQGEFDVVVALYHDQGLAPLKTIEFETAVNVTLGLPWLRVSPDHGTGFELAGRGTAGGGSFSRAIDFALKFAQLARQA